MNKSLIQLILVHFKTFFREPAILFWAVLFPIIMAWVLGVAFSNKGESLRTVYVTGESVIPEKITGEKVLGEETGNVYRIKFQKASEAEAIRAVKRGLITLFIEVKDDSLIYHFDPLNSDAQLTHLILERSIADVSTKNTSIDPLQSYRDSLHRLLNSGNDSVGYYELMHLGNRLDPGGKPNEKTVEKNGGNSA